MELHFSAGVFYTYFALLMICEGNYGDLNKVLHHYETLHQSDIVHHHHVTKRRADSGSIYQNRVISFDTLGRHFKLHLTSRRHLFTKDFQAQVIRSDKDQLHYETIPLKTEEFYEGYVEDEPDSVVSAHWENNDLLARIRTNEDTFIVEPSWRHLPKSRKHSMLSYRASDVKTAKERDPQHHANGTFCGYVSSGLSIDPQHNDMSTVDDAALPEYTYIRNTSFHGRYKRQAGSSQVCTVALVADYRFTKSVGDQNAAVTAKYLAGVLGTVNDIYHVTNFGDGYLGTGFEIRSIFVYVDPSSSPTFNRDQATWQTQKFLETFGEENWSDYCLAHIFTYQAFEDGIQGLAWLASAKFDTVGGICSPVYSNRYYNTAWTSHKNSYGNRIVAQEADLVTAHELGHSWGSPHDPANCAPNVFSGGKYLMYQYSVSGFDPNNNHFSPCSISSINSVLKAKAPSCFVTRSDSYCGNFHVEEGEQCDAGTTGLRGLDRCCTSQCQLLKTARCSDVNSPCCENCAFKANGASCRAESVTTCEAAAICSGSTPDCPTSDALPDGYECANKGTCKNGQCVPLCESNGLISCSCEELDTACKFCCRSNEQSQCIPYTSNGGPFNMNDGHTCYAGYCVQGVCVETDMQNTARLWDIIQSLDFNAILKWMKNNIVLATIVISLVLYIPLCLVVFCIDKRIEKKEADEVDWHSKDNAALIRDGDDDRINWTTGVKHRPDKRTNEQYQYQKLSPSQVDYQ